jgi:uncharacterized delta-60 repeat protein
LRFVVLLLALGAAVWPAGTAFAAPGDDDPTFSGDGIVTTPIAGRPAHVEDLAVQPDGKIVAVGWVGDEVVDDFAIARYLPNGRLDRSFGGDGRLLVAFGAQSSEGKAVAIQPDGRILVAGYVDGPAGYEFAIVRLLRNGRLDRSFGGDGRVRTPINGYAVAFAIALQRDGKVLAAGTVFNAAKTDPRFGVVRYRPNGSVDTSYGNGGRAVIGVGTSFATATAAVIQPDGKLVVAGSAVVLPGDNDFALIRLTRRGRLDSRFGDGGRQVTAFPGGHSDRAFGLALQPDGRVVAAGETQAAPTKFALVRYRANGTPDPSFGSGGLVTTEVPINGYAEDVVVQRNGRIVAVGPAPNVRTGIAFVRYTRGGELDGSFGFEGKATTSLGDVHLETAAAALQRNGRLLAGGSTRGAGGTADFALVRVLESYPRISVGDAARREGDGGTTIVRVPVRLSLPPGTSNSVVSFRTVELDARSPGDFTSRSGTLAFTGAQIRRWVTLSIVGDRRDEGNEVFRLVLSSPSSASLGDRRGTVTIRDDD